MRIVIIHIYQHISLLVAILIFTYFVIIVLTYYSEIRLLILRNFLK